MRNINEIIIHCTATPRGRHVTVDELRAFHVKQNGWADVGYHYIVCLDGSVHRGRADDLVGAHCLGHNAGSIGVAYVGGVEADGSPADTRTPQQKESLKRLVEMLLKRYPGATVHGHNEFAAKACPSFNVKAEFGLLKTILIAVVMMTMTACGSVRKTIEFRTDVAERVDEVTSDKVFGAIDLVEFSDLVMTIDSVEVERIDSENSVSKIKSGRVTVKLSRETTSRAVESVERETEVNRDSVVVETGYVKTDVKSRLWSGRVWLILMAVVIVVGSIYKIVKK